MVKVATIRNGARPRTLPGGRPPPRNGSGLSQRPTVLVGSEVRRLHQHTRNRTAKVEVYPRRRLRYAIDNGDPIPMGATRPIVRHRGSSRTSELCGPGKFPVRGQFELGTTGSSAFATTVFERLIRNSRISVGGPWYGNEDHNRRKRRRTRIGREASRHVSKTAIRRTRWRIGDDVITGARRVWGGGGVCGRVVCRRQRPIPIGDVRGAPLNQLAITIRSMDYGRWPDADFRNRPLIARSSQKLGSHGSAPR